MQDSDTAGQSLYFVRALSYCDINKIELDDLKEVLQTYPEFAEQFIRKFHVTFDLKKVSAPSSFNRISRELDIVFFHV